MRCGEPLLNVNVPWATGSDPGLTPVALTPLGFFRGRGEQSPRTPRAEANSPVLLRKIPLSHPGTSLAPPVGTALWLSPHLSSHQSITERAVATAATSAAPPPSLSAGGSFCCRGCESVFSILSSFGLDRFYALDDAPGVSQQTAATLDAGRFACLDDPDVAARLITFDDGRLARVTLSIPTIHCASCVWLLEQLWRFEPGVVRAEVDSLRRRVHVEFRSAETTLRRVAETIASLGYEPAITVEDGRLAQPPAIRRLYLQLGVAGFAFGNIMLFSIPRYANGGPLEGGFQRLFDVLNVLFALPVLLFSASDYFRIAWRAVRTRVMALEIPLALGLAALFGRSLVDIAAGRGEGFMDSFAGLVFFLLIGRLFQLEGLRPHRVRPNVPFVPTAVGAGGARWRTGIDTDRTASRRRPHPRTSPGGRPGRLGPARRGAGSWTTPSSPASRRPSPSNAARRCAPAGASSAGRCDCGLQRDVTHSQLASLWTNQVFSKPKAHWLADVAAHFGGWFTVAAIGFAAVWSNRVVARRGAKRQRRDGRPHHRVPVRPHVVGADHAWDRHGTARDARTLFEVAGGGPRPQPDRHGGVRQDGHADHRRCARGDRAPWPEQRRAAARPVARRRIRPPDEPRHCRRYPYFPARGRARPRAPRRSP